MTPRTLLLPPALTIAMLASTHAFAGGSATAVVLSAPDEAVVGTPTHVTCTASDPDGVRRIAVTVTGPDGVSTVLAAAFGVSIVEAEWVPGAAGLHGLRCLVKGASSPDAEGTAWREIAVVQGTATPPPSYPDVTTVPPGDPLPPAAVGQSVYQDDLPVQVIGPRKVAATAEGDLFVADVAGQLTRLTRRGERVATTLTNVATVAGGPGVVFAALRDASVLRIDAHTGRILGRVELGVSDPPAGLAYDAVRDVLWVAFPSGAVVGMNPDGTLVHRLASTASGQLGRLVDVAVDAAGGIVWVAQDRVETGGMIHGFAVESGEYLRSIGSSAAGQVRIVGGLAYAGGRVFVTDIFSGKVQVLDPDLGPVDAMGQYGDGPGELRTPAGLAFMANGDLVVANMDANRLDRFGSGVELPSCAGDADCDGLPDAWEQAFGLDPANPADAVSDADGDGLNESEEYANRSSPRSKDSDGDGWSDADEVLAGYDPADGDDHRPVMIVDTPADVDPGVVQLAGRIDDRGKLGGCSVQWRQITGPVVTLRDAATVTPSFVARRGVFRFEAVARCGPLASAPARFDVAVRNVAPVADGGRVATVDAGARVTLAASASSDANGDALSFVWDQLLGAPVLATTPGDAVPLRLGGPGYYLFRLGALDPSGYEGAAEVPVVAVGDTGAPTAIASSPVLARVGDRVVLDASGSYRGAGATFSWEQVAGPWAELQDATTEAPSFQVEWAGRYSFLVSVLDADGFRSPPAHVEVYAAGAVGDLPVARIAAPAVVAVGAPVVLDGRGSTAAVGGELGHWWRQVSGPAAGLTRADRPDAAFVAFAPGSYELELLVSEGEALSLPARVRLEARAAATPIPVAVASAPGTARVGERVVLDGSASTRAARHRWTQVEGPWTPVDQGKLGSFRPATPGVYGFELEVDDGGVRSAPARVTVVVF